MADKNTITKEHAYKQIEKYLRNDELKNLLLLYGKEQYLVNWAINAIINKYVNDTCQELNLSKLNANTVTFDEIRENCETLPLLSDKRVVLVKDFKLVEGIKNKSIGEDDEKQLNDYLKCLPNSCILILTSDGVDKRKKLFKTIEEHGCSYDFNKLDEKLLKSFIIKKLKEAGKIANVTIIEELITITGYYDKETDYTLYNLDNDIKKIIAFNEGSEIVMSDIAETITSNINTDVFAMIEALSRDRKKEAFQLLHNLLVNGEKEYKLIALICAQFELILAVKEMKDEGITSRDIVTRLGIHEFRVKKALTFTERYTLNHLRKILLKAYEIDKNIKTGLLEPSIALEMFIAEI